MMPTTARDRVHRSIAMFPDATRVGDRTPPIPGWRSVTAREAAVLRAIATGDSNTEIGRRLGISRQTVKKHVSALIQKLHVRNRVQLAVLEALRASAANSRESK
jgi:DNA-binding NarL/FixJ family response regulator